MFAERQEDWIARGDRILDLIDQLVVNDLFTRLSVDALATFWKEMTAITFQVLYAMAAVEARLDTLSIS